MLTLYVCNNHSRINVIVMLMLLCLLSSFVLHLFLLFVCQDGSTPLHEASSGGHIEVVRLLLDRGAEMHAKDEVSE